MNIASAAVNTIEKLSGMAGRWSCNWMMVQYALYTNGYNYVSIHCLKWTKCACRGQRYIHES